MINVFWIRSSAGWYLDTNQSSNPVRRSSLMAAHCNECRAVLVQGSGGLCCHHMVSQYQNSEQVQPWLWSLLELTQADLTTSMLQNIISNLYVTEFNVYVFTERIHLEARFQVFLASLKDLMNRLNLPE